MDTFQPHSLLHAAVIAALLSSAALLAIMGRRQPHRNAPSRLEIFLGWGNFLLWLATTGIMLFSERFNPAYSLPLHVCDLTALVVSLVLLTRWRPFRSLLYFWGLGLSTQAVLTPDLAEGPSSIAFWLFWLTHGAILAIAIYDIAVNQFRPNWRDYAIGIGASLGYLAIVLPINIAFNTNYGYVGNSLPEQPTLLDTLGPWPQRIVLIALLVWLGMTLMMLPWELAKWRSRSKNLRKEHSPH